MNLAVSPSSARRFFEIADALCRAVGNAIRPGTITAAMAMMVVHRISRTRRILLALEVRFLAGLAVRRVHRDRLSQGLASAEGVEAGNHCSAKRSQRLPQHFGWLCPLVPSEAACHAGQLRAVLAEPAMQEFLAACPQAVRVLAPLCRMLGIERAAFEPKRETEDMRLPDRRVRRRPVRPVLVDLELEDAHFAFTRIPRRLRLRPWKK